MVGGATKNPFVPAPASITAHDQKDPGTCFFEDGVANLSFSELHGSQLDLQAGGLQIIGHRQRRFVFGLVVWNQTYQADPLSSF